jgi:hypothetical protein
MPIVNPISPGLSAGNWVKPFLVHPSLRDGYFEGSYTVVGADNSEVPLTTLKPHVNQQHIILGSFLKTYGFDGYEVTSNTLTSAEGVKFKYGIKSIAPSLALATFFGLPTRLQNEGQAEYTWRQFVRNLFGGWDAITLKKHLVDVPVTKKENELEPVALLGSVITDDSLSSEPEIKKVEKNDWASTLRGKRLWNLLLLVPFKLVIAAFKLVSIPFKFALNVVKIFTEFLPEVVLNYSGYWAGHAARLITSKQLAPTIIGLLAAIVVFPVHYTARIVALLGTALTSPEKSARMAWEYSRALNSRVLGTILGAIGATMSIAISALLWVVFLPFVVGEVLVLFPQLIPVLTAISRLPIVASSLTLVTGTFGLVAGSLPAAFSAAATSIATFLGISVSATVLAVSATTAVVAAPVTTIASRLADELSNAWARWTSEMTLQVATQQAVKQIAAAVPKRGREASASHPSAEADQLVSKKSRHDEVATKAADYSYELPSVWRTPVAVDASDSAEEHNQNSMEW